MNLTVDRTLTAIMFADIAITKTVDTKTPKGTSIYRLDGSVTLVK